MFKRVMSKLATAGTVAIVGYEVGKTQHSEINNQGKGIETSAQSEHTDVIIFGIVVIIMLLVAIAIRVLVLKKRPIL